MIKSSKKDSQRLVSGSEKKDEKLLFQNTLRPKNLWDYVWQEPIKKHLWVSISSAKIRWETLEHILFYGPPGLGKTTLSYIISEEMGWKLKSTSGPAIEKQSDLVSILSNLENGDIIFIDEIHRLKPQVEEVLYTAMEDFFIDIMVWVWTWAQWVKLPIKPFTLIWATTRLSSLSSPLRDRFWNILKLDFYNELDIEKIIQRNSSILDIWLNAQALKTIAKKSRWTPRIANRLIKMVRDYKTIWKDISKEKELDCIFEEIWIDKLGLDYLDRKYLKVVLEKFSWWPVWLNTISWVLWEEESTLEDVVEPYLLQIWFIERTPRGRKISPAGINYLN